MQQAEMTSRSEASTAPRDDLPVFVLVHGAWCGGWSWSRLVPLLRARGAQVHAPTLTGLGERAHLLSPEVGTETHVQDVASLIWYEDLTNVVLVGHSYGGMLLESVAGAADGRVSQLVFLDAFMPGDGQALSDYAPLPPKHEDGWRVPPPTPPGTSLAAYFGITEPEDQAWVGERFSDQPLKSFTEAVRRPVTDRVERRSYVLCTDAPWFLEAAGRAQRWGYEVHELQGGGHFPFITRPRGLAALLLQEAG